MSHFPTSRCTSTPTATGVCVCVCVYVCGGGVGGGGWGGWMGGGGGRTWGTAAWGAFLAMVFPLAPSQSPSPHCSRTKAQAEQIVLKANMTPLVSAAGRGRRRSSGGSSGHLRTCALRPAGIWGPGELRHLPRM